MVDPCARDTPLMASGTTPLFHSLQVASNTQDSNHAIAFEIVFDSIFVIFNNED